MLTKPSPKIYSSSEHSVKAYADDVTLISDSLKAHVSVWQQVDQRPTDFVLSFKPSKCIFYLFDSYSHQKEGFQLPGGFTRSKTEGGTKCLGKSLELSLVLATTKATVLQITKW